MVSNANGRCVTALPGKLFQLDHGLAESECHAPNDAGETQPPVRIGLLDELDVLEQDSRLSRCSSWPARSITTFGADRIVDALLACIDDIGTVSRPRRSR
jgi:hypothetical protein